MIALRQLLTGRCAPERQLAVVLGGRDINNDHGKPAVVSHPVNLRGPAAGQRPCITRRWTRQAWRSVDRELIVLRVFHRDPVVVDPFLLQDPDRRGAQIGQPSRLGVDSLPAGCDRNGSPAASVDVQVQPVPDRLALGYYLEPDAGRRRRDR